MLFICLQSIHQSTPYFQKGPKQRILKQLHHLGKEIKVCKIPGGPDLRAWRLFLSLLASGFAGGHLPAGAREKGILDLESSVFNEANDDHSMKCHRPISAIYSISD